MSRRDGDRPTTNRSFCLDNDTYMYVHVVSGLRDDSDCEYHDTGNVSYLIESKVNTKTGRGCYVDSTKRKRPCLN